MPDDTTHHGQNDDSSGGARDGCAAPLPRRCKDQRRRQRILLYGSIRRRGLDCRASPSRAGGMLWCVCCATRSAVGECKLTRDASAVAAWVGGAMMGRRYGLLQRGIDRPRWNATELRQSNVGKICSRRCTRGGIAWRAAEDDYRPRIDCIGRSSGQSSVSARLGHHDRVLNLLRAGRDGWMDGMPCPGEMQLPDF